MKRHLRNFLLLLSPIFLIILVNEYSRIELEKTHLQISSNKRMNPASSNPQKCTWVCHNDTQFCKDHHVKIAKPFLKQLDPLYFGLINAMKGTGNYRFGNIIFLAVLWPLLIFFLMISVWSNYLKIIKMKKE